MNKLFLFLLFPALLFSQTITDIFPKIGFCDYFWTLKEYNAPITDFHYDELSELGLTHIVTFGSDTSLNNGYGLKVIDDNLRWYVNHPLWGSYFYPYFFCSATGNETISLPYEVGGIQANYLSKDDNWGFGSAGTRYLKCEIGPPETVSDTFDFDNSIWVFCSRKDTNSPGIFLTADLRKSHQPDSQSQWKTLDYYLRIKAKIEQIPGGNPTDTVANIRIYENNNSQDPYILHGYPQKYDSIEYTDGRPWTDVTYPVLANEFSSGNYILVEKGPFQKKGGWGTYFTVEITWMNKRTLLVDNFSVYDNFYKSLWLTDSTEIWGDIVKSQLRGYFNQLATNQNFEHLYMDEPYLLMNRSFKFVSDKFGEEFPHPQPGKSHHVNSCNFAYNQPDYETMDRLRRPVYAAEDYYPFLQSLGTSTSKVQAALDNLIGSEWTDTLTGLRSAIKWAQGDPENPADDIPFYHVMQVHASWLKNGGHWQYRLVSEPEIFVQGNLALCYGAKGIGYWHIFTMADTTYKKWGKDWGLFDDSTNIFTGDSSNLQDIHNPVIPNSRYYSVKELNEHIDKLAPELLQLTWINGVSLNRESLPAGYITNVTTMADTTDLIEDKYIELGLFRKDVTDSNQEHFMLVNRRCNPNESRFIKTTLNKSSYDFINWEVKEIGGTYTKTLNKTGYFITLITPGMGKLFRYASVVKYGGNLLFNETISSTVDLTDNLIINPNATLTITGTYNLYDTLVINSGGTLYMAEGSVLKLMGNGKIEVQSGGSFIIEKGAELYFYNSHPLTVNGTLNAQGVYGDSVIFTRGGSSGTWGSMKFDGSASSNSILNYVKITYASDIQCLNSANVTIQNSRIQDCTEGIYIYNSEPGIYSNHIINPLHNGINASGSGYEVEILDNTIVKDSNNPQYKQYQGIYIQNSLEGYIGHNDISGFLWGMYIGGGSSSYFLDKELNGPYPNNRVVTCYRGVGVGWGSYFVGGIDERGGYNTIMDNTANDMRVYQSSTAYAQFNYWGGDEGNNYVDGTSELYDDIYLDEDPWGESYQMLALGATNNELLNGLLLEKNNDVTGAVNHYKQMITRNSSPVAALRRLAVIRRMHNINNLQVYLVSLLEGNSPYKPVIMNLLAGLSLNGGNYNQAMNLYNTIIQSYPNSYHSINARFERFFAALNYAKEDTTASQILSEIQALNLNEEEYLMRLETAVDLLDRFNGSQNLNKSGNSPKVTTEENLPKEYSLSQNYPNPFNPVTTISYSLPQDSKVSLVVYDIIGREVTTLVNEEKKAGRYEVHFNASSLASGIYLYKIKSGSYTDTKKMILLK